MIVVTLIARLGAGDLAVLSAHARDDSRLGLGDVRSAMMNVSVLGAGAWGTALSLVLSRNLGAATLWTWEEAHAQAMLEHAENTQFLPGYFFPSGLTVTSDLERACRGCDLLLVVVPSHAVASTLEAAVPLLGSDVRVVTASKGIEATELRLMSEVVADVLGLGPERIGVLSGPSFAREVAAQVPTNVVAASKDAAFAKLLQRTFSTEWLRVYTSRDPVGVEIGGAMKNVVAIAAGACAGLGLGDNTRAALITRGIAEMARLVDAKGGDRLTMAGLAGIGDLVLTCMGEQSRNRTLGYRLGRGEPLDLALRESNGVAEGYLTARSVVRLGQKLRVELPISEAVDAVLQQKKSAKQALSDLLSRPLRGEWE